ncbi:E3 ubiquitin-protein ligase [Salix suchowensis]|nr:E3 ubiquitin-protein ligase [Salix suchowensis]
MELGSMWDYEETIDELKQKLMYTTIELESLKAEANEEHRKHREDVGRLITMLKAASQERDEAKEHLQNILDKLIPSNPTESLTFLPQSQSGNPSITESNSLSDHTHNHRSHGSSPVDSFFDAIACPDFSSINMGFASSTFVKEYDKSSVSAGLEVPAVPGINPADAVIENFVKGKVLPQRGNLLQAVMETGPLLQTLLLAGPLPRWRNPPPLQPVKMLPVSTINHNASFLAQKPLDSPSYIEFRRGSSKTCSSMLNFSSGASGSGLDNGCLLNSGAIHQIPAGKRQRF